ncbi:MULTISPECIES: VOC family protein [Brucella]|uniref:VOC family protein n=1 Tax=Brucella inopinata TaxID=1218315 RepID=A0AAW7BDI9_9HYPH|nr:MULTISPECIES: VOC family protein [Brucella]EEZ32795.1 glyoxalase/bleomycin resistance protein/dioxygenase [Brucella sp. 83/13]EFM57538.1 biphenyl-2,3-diol 1,2-dioxygenase 3 [Brucella inopinata BO1]KEY03608.1 glyoxalase/bleomycin resistance protein/dioxygenase [Brucella suis bv. 4 str. 40]MDL2332573.1 VOC family protein [Brucella inopinata]
MVISRRKAPGTAGAADEALPSAAPVPFAMTTPVRVARIGLKARDAEMLAEYYRDVVGLREMARRSASIVLGAGDRELMEIEQFSAARPDDPRSAGLYHTAFLLPTRGDLARWSRRAIDKQLPVSGAADHKVSEAIYLTDPEGNGIEIYADRPHDQWQWNGDRVTMSPDLLDVCNLLDVIQREGGEWDGAPQNTMVGHVNLRVGNAQEAETFWHNELGFETVQTYGDRAVFMSTGRYHHHIAANAWQSAGAGKRDMDRTGLSWVELEDTRGGNDSTFVDPWGNVVNTIRTKA